MSPVRVRSPTLKSHKDLGRFQVPDPASKMAGLWQGKKRPPVATPTGGPQVSLPAQPVCFHGRFAMKKPYPWFRCGRGWYVEIDETQHFLGRHPDDAPPPQKSKKTRLWNPPQSILDAFYEKM